MTFSRRKFLGALGGAIAGNALASGAAPALLLRRDQRPDIILRGGNVFDGLGGAPVTADVVISAGRITAIAARATTTGATESDVRGLAVAPGFIDIHSHGDGSLSSDPRAESVIRQGVTTIVVGQDGTSRGVVRDPDATARAIETYLASIGSIPSCVNVATMVGLGSVRGAVIGSSSRAATPDEIRQMTAIVEGALAAGACGASSGLEYTPGAFATTGELAAVCRPLAARRLPYATHMRNEDDRLLDSIDESIAVARGAGCPLQISHLKTQGPRNWSKLDAVFARIATARGAGVDVTLDRYPYIAYATSLTNLFPVWSREGGRTALVARMSDQATAVRVKSETLAKVEMIGGWDNVQITSGVSDAALRGVIGQRVGAFAAGIGLDPYELTRRLIAGSSPGMVGFAMSEENLDRILAHPQATVCSDGGAVAIDRRSGSPHPRALGSFPRVLGRYVRERKALTLQDAIRKMTSAPADRLRLADRGRLAQGMAADVVVFDPATVGDRATFEDPWQYPVGISAVIVNGAFALRDGGRGERGSGLGLPPGATFR